MARVPPPAARYRCGRRWIPCDILRYGTCLAYGLQLGFRGILHSLCGRQGRLCLNARRLCLRALVTGTLAGLGALRKRCPKSGTIVLADGTTQRRRRSAAQLRTYVSRLGHIVYL